MMINKQIFIFNLFYFYIPGPRLIPQFWNTTSVLTLPVNENSQLKVVFLFYIPLKSVGQKSVDLACEEKLERNQDFQLPFHLKNKTNKKLTV